MFTSCSYTDKNKGSYHITDKVDGITSFDIDKKIHDFGEMVSGEITSCSFKLTNKGKYPLIIKNIEASCGCTLFNWNKKPVPPGGHTKIEVEFNSYGRYGKQYKVISIFANISEQVKDVAITAYIKK